MKVSVSMKQAACPARKAFGRAPTARPALKAESKVSTVKFLQTRPVRDAFSSLPVRATNGSAAPDGKKTAIITGTSSGLGLHAAKHLANSGDWHIIMANRDYSKTLIKARQVGIPRDAFTYIQCDLASLESVHKFVDEFRATGRQLDALVCNAAVYLPVDPEPSFSVEGFELSVAVNHLGHFLLANLLLPDLEKSDWKRMVIIGSITGNRNTLAGNIPPQADLGNLEGFKAGFQYPNVMINGGTWEAPKAYKDAKVCNMLTTLELHRRFHDKSGITFSTLYPGCIAETGLFRNHVKAFQVLFPKFQKNITQGYVSEDEAGRRLASVVGDKTYAKSGVYWSWDKDSEPFVNTLSEEAQDLSKAEQVWQLSEQLVGLKSGVAKEPAMA
eukprot:jgi/Ulvmu1/9335/UM050_0085.1